MSTVVGTVELEFSNGIVLSQTHTWSADLPALHHPGHVIFGDAIGQLLTVWEVVQPDIVALVTQWGSLVDLSWTLDVSATPDVIPLPGALGLLVTALVAGLIVVRRI